MIKKMLITIIAINISIAIFVLSINLYINQFSKNDIGTDFPIEEKLQDKPIWLVLGASVKADGTPSDILKDRLDTAKEYYNKWIIAKIIVSGDNREKEYNEPINMQKYLIHNGVSSEDIYIDYAGFDTYDSIYRADFIFGADNIIIFSQEYHLPRAVYIAKKLWIKAKWAICDKHKYIYIKYYKRREVLSKIKAFWEVDIYNSKPKFLGDKIEIKY